MSRPSLPSITRGSSAASGAARIQSRRAAKLESLTANPFKMPNDAEVFQLRDEERRRKREDKEKMKNLKIWEKSTRSTRLVTNRTGEEEDLDGEPTRVGSRTSSRGAAANKTAPAAASGSGGAGRERRKEKENIRDFIAKKREMFLVQMSLDTKRSEIKKLEELAAQREQLLRKNEQMLEEDALRFDAFLKENDMRAIDAMDRAEVETKAKQEKLAEIKKLNAQISVIKQEMSKAEDQLTNCRRYKKFLDSLTPAQFFEEEMAKKRARQATRRQARREAKLAILKEKHEAAKQEEQQQQLSIKQMGRERSRKNMARQASTFRENEEPPPSPTLSDVSSDEEGYSSGEDLPMYFKDPQQLLDIFTALEEKNLFLIQNSQETEEALEELKQKYKETREKMDQEANNLKSQINTLKANIGREQQKANQMQNRARRTLGAEDKEGLLKSLHAQITGVYLACGFDNESLGALEMLTNIEAKLEALLEVVSRMPNDYVETAEKAREKERRHRAREDKLERQRKDQEKRLQKSLARSKAPVIKKTGKPVMFRSMPKTRKRKDKDEAKRKAAEEDDIREFFQ